MGEAKRRQAYKASQPRVTMPFAEQEFIAMRARVASGEWSNELGFRMWMESHGFRQVMGFPNEYGNLSLGVVITITDGAHS
jgi:hypothetical protein